MKCKIIRGDIEVNESCVTPEMLPSVVRRDVMRNGVMQSVAFWGVGTVLDHPESYYLVRQGCAVPADQECEIRAARSPEQQRAAQYAYERLNRGIHPEDFAAYDSGWMTGYNPDGMYIPGPNYHEMPQDDGDEDDDE